MKSDELLQSALQLHRAGKTAQAEAICRDILKFHPDTIHALHLLGVLRYQARDYASAAAFLEKALRLAPASAIILNNLGNVYLESGRADDAIACYRKALRLDPGHAEAHNNLGSALEESGHVEEALACYREALRLNPALAEAHNNLGNALKESGHVEEALACYREARRLNPALAEAPYNTANILLDRGQTREAIDLYRAALGLDPSYVDALTNLGAALKSAGEIEEAIACYRKALGLQPGLADAHWNLAAALLLRGDFINGWKEYEWRWETKDFHRRHFPQPLWDGHNCEGETILLYAEQGFGDTIQFIRYVPLLARRGVRVLVECPGELKTFVECVEGVHRVITPGDPLPDFTAHCPLLSLPLVLGTTLETVPAEIPYCSAPRSSVERWSTKLGQRADNNIRVGLAWAGKPSHKKDKYRSLSLETLRPLWEIAGITFFSLQKGESALKAGGHPDGMELADYTDELKDFADTAALLENLDLVISVDTAVAHAAGALGRDVWTLVPCDADWRWILERTDSPWYPSMRLFRQDAPDGWDTVVSRIAEALADFVLRKRDKA
jgi:tetratricopeptide (TPR) repeat protein